MTALSRALVVAEMQARDLSRRRVAIGLFVLLPLAFYYSIPAEEDYGMLAGAIGVSWAVVAAGLFGVLGWRRVDPRLALAGARPAEGLVGRLVVLQVLAFALVAVFAPLLLTRSAALVVDARALVLGLVLLATVSVPLGLAIGTLVPRELEGTLVVVGIVGVEMSVPLDAPVAPLLPLYGPLRILGGGAGVIDGPISGALVHAAVTVAVLLAGSYLLWRRRVHPAGVQ